MAVVGFNFTKLLAERKKPVKGKVNINNHVAITEVEEGKMAFEKGKKSAQVTFKYTSDYEPGVAEISIEGNVLYVEDGKKMDEYMAEWKKNKTMPRDVMTDLINSILSKCNIQSLIMSRDLNLPTPIPLPKVSGQGTPSVGSKPKKK